MIVPTEVYPVFYFKMREIMYFMKSQDIDSIHKLEVAQKFGFLSYDIGDFLKYYQYASFNDDYLRITKNMQQIIIDLCNFKIKEFEKLENDRNLDIELKRTTIDTSKIAQRISIIALIFASLSAFGTIWLMLR